MYWTAYIVKAMCNPTSISPVSPISPISPISYTSPISHISHISPRSHTSPISHVSHISPISPISPYIPKNGDDYPSYKSTHVLLRFVSVCQCVSVSVCQCVCVCEREPRVESLYYITIGIGYLASGFKSVHVKITFEYVGRNVKLRLTK